MRSLFLTAVLPTLLFACGGPVGEGDGIVDPDEEARIGWEAELIGSAHDVSGTAVLVAEDRLEIRDFYYDGGGLNARFFLVAAGARFNRDIELTGNLVGSPSDGETLVLDLPEGLEADAWNAITLWCIPAGVSFGEGVFGPPEDA